jgi:hypothetical protein
MTPVTKYDFETDKFTITKGLVEPIVHKKPRERAVHYKVTSIVRVEPNGSHKVLKSDVTRTNTPKKKLAKPDLVMKQVTRYLPDGTFKCNQEVIDVNRSLKHWGYSSIDEIMDKAWPTGSPENRIKQAFVLKKRMTPEDGDQVTVQYSPMTGTY